MSITDKTDKTATAARNAVQLSKQGPYAWGVVERDGKLIAQGLSKGAAEALAKTATACQKTPEQPQNWEDMSETAQDEWMRNNAELQAQHSPTFDEACSHPAVRDVLSERDRLKTHAGKLAEALRRIAYDPIGKSDATHREVLEGIENIAREALARWESEARK